MPDPRWLDGGVIVAATPVNVLHIGEVVHTFLHNHGCVIEPISRQEDRLIYPVGSTRQQLYPLTSDIRYKVLLPDGIELREIDRRGHQQSSLLVSVVIDERSQAELEHYITQFHAQ
ncbi:MAG: hypothetical protein M3Y39_20340 [Chloroflexota bacterium]|nr:hypothetical protein [Chloroflexota bacterium]